MILLPDFDNICKSIKANDPRIKSYVLAVTEKTAIKYLKDKPGPVLVAIVPSADSEARTVDSFIEVSTAFFFIVEKANSGDLNEEKEKQQLSDLQLIMEKLKSFVLSKKGACDKLYNLKPGSFKTDPEDYIFGGYNGWSLSFDF